MAKKTTKKSTKSATKSKAKAKVKPVGKAATKATAPKPAIKPKKPAIKVKKSAVKAKGKPAAKPVTKTAAKANAKPVVKVVAAPAPAAKKAKKTATKAGSKASPASAHATFTEPSHSQSPAVAMTGTPANPNTPIEQSRAFAIEAARLLSDDKCTDIVVLDVSKLGAEQDFIIIGSGTSDRQMRSVLDDVAELGTASGHTIAHQSIDDRATWVLADFFDVVIHLFEPNTRAYYDLEMMWGDAPKVVWERAPGDKPKPRNRRVFVNAAGEESATDPSTNED